jgi:hypothetical protein
VDLLVDSVDLFAQHLQRGRSGGCLGHVIPWRPDSPMPSADNGID